MYLQRRCHVIFQLLNGMKTLFPVLWFSACTGQTLSNKLTQTEENPLSVELSYSDSLVIGFEDHPDFYAAGFDFPVGKPEGKGYYNAQSFRTNNHLGDDWNGKGGGNSDMGDTVYAVANGYVTQSIQFFGGWGKVIKVASAWKSENDLEMVETLYAHFEKMLVKKGEWVKKGQAIGTIGNAEGIYYAHLHLEIRKEPGMELGAGYAKDATGYLDPTKFIKSHRKILGK